MERTSKPRAGAPRVRAHAPGRGLLLLEDIGAAISHSADACSTLERIVTLVADRLDMEVCTVYSYTPGTERLVLMATKGLVTASSGTVSMGVDEGLTGLVIEKGEPVMAIDAPAHPRYKYFPETGEERYHSFLGVPIMDKRERLGVLVVQTSRRRRFTRDEVRLLRAVAIPVGGLLVQFRLLQSLESKEEERSRYQRRLLDAVKRLQVYERQQEGGHAPAQPTALRLTGLAASPGYGVGRAHLLVSQVGFVNIPERRALPVKKELARFHSAVKRAVREVEGLKQRVQESYPEIDSTVFDTQRLMLVDSGFNGRVEAAIKGGAGAEAALDRVVSETVAEFSRLSDGYMQERAFDIKDIGKQVLRHLLGVGERDRSFASAVVLAAQELSLSDIMLIDREQLKGIVIATGGVTSHASILAKSMEIPTVVGVESVEESIREGDHLVVDGNAGTVYVNPSVEVVREYERLTREYQSFNRELDHLRDLPATTPDGCRIHMGANIGLLGDVELARRHGADGIGLYRTEFAFLSHRDLLSEAEQVELYTRVVRSAGDLPITIRTLDLGADKYPTQLHFPHEANPFLGWRSTRISLDLPNLFRAQLRAILRASAAGKVRIMFPMISGVEEIRRVREHLAAAGDELRVAGYAFDPQLPIGIMVEVPSAVQLADRLIEEVDFFSIGTNDLVQYVLAVDRSNRKVAPLYQPLHPAVLRAVANTVAVARAAGKGVSICGEMAADPACTLVLIGMGFRELSMSSFFIPVIKRLIRSVEIRFAEQVAGEVLKMGTVKEIKGHVFEQMRSLGAIDLLDMYH